MLSTGQKPYRLPTEAEWEYAAKGGNESQGYKFAGSDDLNQVGWHRGSPSSKTHSVGQKKANEIGLFDMSGNVWEWCEDAWHDNYQGAPVDGSAWVSGGENLRNVCRGGSWDNLPIYCTVTSRLKNGSYDRDNFVGFRLARDE